MRFSQDRLPTFEKVGSKTRSDWTLSSVELLLCTVILLGGVALHFPAIYFRLGLPIEAILSLVSYLSPISGMFWLSASQVIPDPPVGPIHSSQWAIGGFLLWQLVPHRPNIWQCSRPILFAITLFFVWSVAMNFIHGGGASFPLLLIYALLTACAAATLVGQSKGRIGLCLLAFIVGQILAASVFWIIKLHLGAPVQAFDILLYGDSTLEGARIGTARGNANMLGPSMALVISGMIGLWLACVEQPKTVKWSGRLIAILGTACALGPLIGSGSRGAIIAVCCSFALVLAILFTSKSKLWIQGAGIGCIAILILAAAWSRLDLKAYWEEMQHRQQEESLAIGQKSNLIAGRELEWRAAIGGILDSPLVGGGEVNRLSFLDNPEMWASHSTYLDAGLVAGIPGMILFCVFTLKPVASLWRRRREPLILFLLGIYTTSVISIGTTSAMQVKYFWILWGIASSCMGIPAKRYKKSASKHKNNTATRWKSGPMPQRADQSIQ